MIAVPPTSTSGESCNMFIAERGIGGGVLLGSRFTSLHVEPLASLSKRVRYDSVASFEAQSLCCATTGDTCCILSLDTDASSGEMTGDWWYMFRTEFTTL